MSLFQKTALPDVLIFQPQCIHDERGWFYESWREDHFREAGLQINFLQDNHSCSREPGTLRGLHFQTPPAAQDKLVRVVRGAIYDVAVDIRKSSPTFGQSVGLRISAEDRKQIFIPRGFAHGFVTLEPDTEVVYKVSAYYSPQHDKGLAFNDPALGINWLFSEAHLTLSKKDKTHPLLSELPAYF